MNGSDLLKIGNDVRPSQNSSCLTYNVEFFHVYTDEKINGVHKGSIDTLNKTLESWDFKPSTIILIDNYNPVDHILGTEEIFKYLAEHNAVPDYWAYEGDLVVNAKVLLASITSDKLRRSYERYIEKRGKYPCSLLTASWYLTRLGHLEYTTVVRKLGSRLPYSSVSHVINILPTDYSSVEARAFDIIKHSTFASSLNKIEDIFYDVHVDKDVKLF